MSKYHARPSQYNGFRFDSLLEREHYKKLLVLEKAGKISDLQVHPRYELQSAFTDSTGTRQRAIVYEADFSYIENGRVIVSDVKGVLTPVFRLKEKMFKKIYPNLELRIIK